MKETNRLKLSNWQLFWHYSIILFILIIPLMNLYSIYQIEVTESYTGIWSVQEHLNFGLPWLIPALIFAIIQYRRLNFKRLKKHLTPEEFKYFVVQTGQKMNWNFINLTKDYAVAISRFNWASWGERITIIRKDNELLINSICDPDNRHSVSSWGRNKKNINAFKKRINTSA